jgi:iojap-like ribosome-associated protein
MLDNIVKVLDDKKAKDIQTMRIEGLSIITDYFVICTGGSTTHIRALADELTEKMSEMSYEVYHMEGYDTARWILVDFGEVIVHIFHEEDRQFYNLERLWADSKSSHK